ncbi:MAG: GNAT family N-acetyltransferase [Anaerolineales bacterium]|nr:GNAT family N-acetyltransferase [Anaerolineales bacterium]
MSTPETHSLPPGYGVRPLQPDDALALEWDGQYIHFRRLYVLAFERAAAGRACLWGVVSPQGELVGQVFVLLEAEHDPMTADGSERAFIHSFRVRPEHRNLGLGRSLLNHAEQDLRVRGFQWVTLNVAEDNPRAMRLYERMGYRPLEPISGRWSFIDHEGNQRQLHEPGWRMGKNLG